MANAQDMVPVLIVGAGPVGLALAGDLGWRGNECLVIEQSDGSIYQPRMDLVGPRTMEFCRRWGIVDAVEASPYPRDYQQDNVYLTSLAGWELGRERFPSMNEEPLPWQSPQKRERCPQNMFDPILKEFAAAQPGVTLRYNTKFLGFEQHADHVAVRVQPVEGGAEEVLRARYLVGCDGIGSTIRESLGIAMHGRAVLTYTTNVIFRCPHLLSLHDKGQAYRHVFVGPEGTWATIVAINGRDQWRMSLIGSAERTSYTDEEINAAIRRAVGVDFDYDILSVLKWVRRELVADGYGRGRVWLCGDSVHGMSPTGAFGMNTGIQEAVDLSWKLDAVLHGWGGQGLLDSYFDERQPIALRAVREASGNLGRMRTLPDPTHILDATPEGDAVRASVGQALTEQMSREWHTVGMHLGYFYDGSPICWADGTPAPVDDPADYQPTARPGSRAPHVWLKDGRSTLDLFGRGFVLLRLGADAPGVEPVDKTGVEPADKTGVEPIAAAAEAVGMQLTVLAIDEPDVVAAYAAKLVLVRPDGHVAWRGDALPDDARALVDCVRGERPYAWRQDQARISQSAQ